MADDFETVPLGTKDERTEDTDDTGSSAPPRAPFSAEPKERTTDLRRMEVQLTDLYATVGTYGGMPFGTKGVAAGAIISRNASNMAAAWVDLAEKDRNVRAAINRLLQAGGWAGVIGAHVMALLPILAVMGALPEPVGTAIWFSLASQDPELYEYLSSLGSQSENGNGAAD